MPSRLGTDALVIPVEPLPMDPEGSGVGIGVCAVDLRLAACPIHSASWVRLAALMPSSPTGLKLWLCANAAIGAICASRAQKPNKLETRLATAARLGGPGRRCF